MVVRQFPLRWLDGDSRRTVEEVLASGWFHGAEECGRIFASFGAGEIFVAQAFGGSWPFLSSGDRIVAPALPVVTGASATVGPDGEYRREAETIVREAVGVEDVFLATDLATPTPGGHFDLLWFTETERYLLRSGVLEVEDLFSVLRIPASPANLDRLLVRARRVAPEVVAGLGSLEPPMVAEIEVRRPGAFSSDDRWRDPRAFLAVRADIRSVHGLDEELVAEAEHGERVVFSWALADYGWRLDRLSGAYDFTTLSMELREGVLSLRASLDPAVSALAAGMRERITFDLRSDLVTLFVPHF